MSLKNKLNRLKSHLTREMKHTEKEEVAIVQPEMDIPFREQWTGLQAVPIPFEQAYIIRREVSYPLSHQHGKYRFQQLAEIVDQWNEASVPHPLSAEGLSASDLMFFDTETTGLHGGTGNTIFLLGYSQVLEDRVSVKQYFLPGPDSEVALYHQFLSDVKELKNLVTYNGKSFDWPQVKTRHTLLRNELPKLPSFGHYDLLHGARRLWKDQLESCRLSLVEKEILQFERQQDTPGYMAPLLYFDYLRDRRPDIIKGVLVHNEWDVLSLISLYIHLSILLMGEKLDNFTDPELYQAGRWFEHCGDLVRAKIFYEKSVNGNSGSVIYKMALANVYKKQKHWDKAITVWEQIHDNDSPLQVDVLTELAKGYEHVYKDYEKALFYADKAYECWKTRKRALRQGKKSEEQAAYLKRIERLEKKCFSG